MKLIFWGFLIIFLDFSITLNGVGFDLLPDAVGYLLVFLGAGRMREESKAFSRMRPIALALTIVHFAALIVNPFGPLELTYGWMTTLVAIAVNLLHVFLDLYLLWQVVRGVQDIETYYDCPLGGYKMRIAYFIILGLQIAATALLYLSTPLYLMILLLSVAGFVVHIVFLVLLWRAAKTYDRLCSGIGPSDGNGEYYPGSEE